MLKKETGAAAFTLTEVMIAVLLMLLTLGLLLSAFISSKRSTALAQTYLAAVQIACNEAERLQTNSYSNIASTVTATSLTNASIEYRMSNSVVAFTNSHFNKFKDIKIAVKWISPASARLEALTNYMTRCYTN